MTPEDEMAGTAATTTPVVGLTGPAGPEPTAPSPVGELVRRLDGVERRPLADQVEVLDAVRRGLDEALARPFTDG